MNFLTHLKKKKHPPLNTHVDVSSRAIGLNLGLRLHLHTIFVYVSSKGSDKSAHLGMLARGFVPQQCDLICWKSHLLTHLVIINIMEYFLSSVFTLMSLRLLIFSLPFTTFVICHLF